MPGTATSGFRVGLLRGAPLVASGTEEHVIFGAAEPLELSEEIYATQHDDDGEVWVLDSEGLSRTVDQGTAIVEIAQVDNLGVSPLQSFRAGGGHATLTTANDLELWIFAKDGPAPDEPTAQSLTPWSIRHIYSDGTVLAHGSLEGTPQTLMIAPDGSIVAARVRSSDAELHNSIPGGFELADGRLMAGTDNASKQVWIVDPSDGSSLRLGPDGKTQQWASNNGRIITITTSNHIDAPDLYWYGAP